MVAAVQILLVGFVHLQARLHENLRGRREAVGFLFVFCYQKKFWLILMEDVSKSSRSLCTLKMEDIYFQDKTDKNPPFF